MWLATHTTIPGIDICDIYTWGTFADDNEAFQQPNTKALYATRTQFHITGHVFFIISLVRYADSATK